MGNYSCCMFLQVFRSQAPALIKHTQPLTSHCLSLVWVYFTHLPGGSTQCSVCVTSHNYLDALGDQALLSVTVLALVEESEQSWVGKVPYRLRIPDLTMTINGKKGTCACHVRGEVRHTHHLPTYTPHTPFLTTATPSSIWCPCGPARGPVLLSDSQLYQSPQEDPH